MSKGKSYTAYEAASRALDMISGDANGEYVFTPFQRRDLADWAEIVHDDEDLLDAHKVLALRFIGEYGTCSEGHNVVAEFQNAMGVDDANEQVLIKDMEAKGLLRIVWTRAIENRILWGVLIGHLVWKPESGAAA